MNIRTLRFDINNLLSVAGVAALLYMVFELRSTLLILLVALVIATFTESFVKLMKRIRFPRVLSVIIFYGLVFALFGGVLFFLLPVFFDELRAIQELYPEIGDALNQFLGIEESEGGAISIIELFESGEGEVIVRSILDNISTLAGGAVNFIILLVVSFYLSVQEGGIERFIRILVPLKFEAYALDLWARTKKKIGLWFNGQLFIALILVILTYLGLLLFGVPSAFLLALLAGLFGLIPYGIYLATVPAVALGILDGGIELGIIVFILYMFIQQITDYILQPIVSRRLTGLPTLVVILSVILAGRIAGVLGVIIAVPMAVFILEIVHDRESEKRAIMAELEKAEKKNHPDPDEDIDDIQYVKE